MRKHPSPGHSKPVTQKGNVKLSYKPMEPKLLLPPGGEVRARSLYDGSHPPSPPENKQGLQDLGWSKKMVQHRVSLSS